MQSAMTLLILASQAAWSAEATEIAPWLRGDVDFGYTMNAESARLLEGDTQVGKRKIAENLVTIGGNFTFAPGAALFFEVPWYAGTKVSYADATDMAIDPTTDSGTMVDTDVLDPQPEVYGQGAGGAWLGLRGTPFSETLFADRGDKVTWLVEVGYRFQDKSSFWTSDSAGQRGAGPGAAAFRLATAFSTTIKWNQPYVELSMTRTVPMRVIDDTGLQADQIIQPSSSYDLVAGTEIVAVSRESSGARFAIDLRSGFGVRSWQDIPSGTYLPSVLDVSSTLTATESEHTYVNGGLELKYRVMEWVQLDLGAGVGTIMPHQVEHFYPVSTGMGTLTWSVGTELTLRGRDKPERFPWQGGRS